MANTMVLKNVRTRGKRPMRNLSIPDKVRAIQRIHNGETKASVSRHLGVPESTLRGWCKNEHKLRSMSLQPQFLENSTDSYTMPNANVNLPKRASYAKENIPIENDNRELMPPTVQYGTNQYIDNLTAALNMMNQPTYQHVMAQSGLQDSNMKSFDQIINCEQYQSKANGKENIEQNLHDTPFCGTIENVNDNSSIEDSKELITPSNEYDINAAYIKSILEYGNDLTAMQWASMLVGTMNQLVQASIATDMLDKDLWQSGQAAPSEASLYSGYKRTYDDPFSELRNIYELNKSSDFDETSDDANASCDEMPMDLSIKSQ